MYLTASFFQKLKDFVQLWIKEEGYAVRNAEEGLFKCQFLEKWAMSKTTQKDHLFLQYTYFYSKLHVQVPQKMGGEKIWPKKLRSCKTIWPKMDQN